MWKINPAWGGSWYNDTEKPSTAWFVYSSWKYWQVWRLIISSLILVNTAFLYLGPELFFYHWENPVTFSVLWTTRQRCPQCQHPLGTWNWDGQTPLLLHRDRNVAIPQHPPSCKTTTGSIISWTAAFWPSKIYQFINLVPFLFKNIPRACFVVVWNESVREVFPGRMASVWFVCSALLKTCSAGGRKKVWFTSLWPGPRWDPLPRAGVVTSCKAAGGAEINKEKQALGYEVGKSRQETRSVQHKPGGFEREQMQLSFRSDGKKTAACSSRTGNWNCCKQGMHWICWTEKGPKGPAWKWWEICHFNLSCCVFSVSNVALFQFALR